MCKICCRRERAPSSRASTRARPTCPCDTLAAYAASSAVYEWDDEYGDVGPEVPQLEEQLFNNAFRLRQGKHMANLQLEVTVEGPNKIHPVRSVSSHSSLTTWNSTDHHTV